MDKTVSSLRPTVMWKLTTLAMVKVSQMLIMLYWSRSKWFVAVDSIDQTINPLNLPSRTTKFLLRLLMSRYRPSIPQEEVLRPLLMSGIKEVEFEFEVTPTNVNNLINILRRLSQYGRSLTSIKIARLVPLNCHFNCIEYGTFYGEFIQMQQCIKLKENRELCNEITNLILSSPNLRKLKTNIPFDTSSLAKTAEMVELNMPCIKYFLYLSKLYKTESTWGFVTFLDYLPKLRNLNNGDLHPLLSFFRNDQFDNDESKNNCSKAKQYMLSRLDFCVGISKRNLTLVSETFPELKMISFLLTRYTCDMLKKRNEFYQKYLPSIVTECKYSPDLTTILYPFSRQITELNINFYKCSKFELMTICSPLTNLQKLKIGHICLETEKSYKNQDMVDRFQKAFHNLKVFHISCCKCINKFTLYKDFFMSTFANCLEIEDFMLNFRDLNDQLIFDILTNNFLSKLKFVRLFCRSISSRALKHIILNSPELEYIKIASYQFGEDLLVTSNPELDVQQVVHCINPFVYV